ncbi:MAG TPA: isochorismatase family protein [Candidatus Dormibacteraeota bacterium]|jgi:maleamate amidohydrolase|nr:isochorismatase family protein [Candidatus Dormibacteraeota bacterium]
MSQDASTIYRRSGFTGRLQPGRRPALLVVDLSRGFTDPACPLGSDLTDEVLATRRLLDGARAAGAAVVFTRIAYQPNLRDAGIWVRKVPSLAELTVGSPWVELDPRLDRRPEEPLISKSYASAFFGTALASLLAAEGVDTLLVAGATTSGCVRATVVDALQHGYPAFVVRECVGDRAPGPHEANLFDLQAKYAEVIGIEEALAYLAGLDRAPAPALDPA